MENTFNYNSEGTMNLKALIKQQFIHRVSLMIQSMGCYDTQWEVQSTMIDFVSNSDIKIYNCLIDEDSEVSFEIYVSYRGDNSITRSAIEEVLDTMYNER